MNKRLFFLMLCLVFMSWIQAQVYVELTIPQGIDPCLGVPVEIRIINEGNKPLKGASLQFLKGKDLLFRQGSLSGRMVQLQNGADPKGPVFSIDFLDICESLSFSFWMDHGCATQSHMDSTEAVLNWNNQKISSGIRSVQIFSPKISIINLGLYFDETASVFKKKYSIINIGQLALDTFILFVSADDRMNILNSNYGILSSNGDTLTFNEKDFTLIGNHNSFFERGEIIDIEQVVDLNACETDFQISHKIRVPCRQNLCEFTVDDKVKLQAIVGTPKMGILQDSQTTATPCRDGEVNLRLFNTSNNGNFNLGNSIYNLNLNLGWSSIRNNALTDPLRDNCLQIKEVRINGRIVNITTNGFTGYGLDFRRINSDPDGPGGLNDLDKDGYFDDLGPTDTISLSIKYELDPKCLNLGCDQIVFDYRIFRITGSFINYCNIVGTVDQYSYSHYYQWSRPSVYTSRIKSIYLDREIDTIVFQTYKNERNFLTHCDKDSAAVRIILPPVADLLPGAIIIVNGNPVVYRRNGNVIYFSTDTSNLSVSIPLRFTCDPNSGSGGVNTNCTFCLGSGGPKYSLRIEVDYYCGDKCYTRIPLFCGNTPEFASVCNANGGGQNSPRKLVVKDLNFKRLTTGFQDSTKSVRLNPDLDSINHNSFFTYDTFLLHIPIDVLCNASFSNIIFRLAYYPRLYYNVNNQVDTIRDIQWLTDSLKFYDGETNRWSICSSPLGPEYYSLNTNLFYRYFVREINLSSLFGNCLNGSLSTRDSMVLVIKAVIPPSEYTPWTKTSLNAQLSYNQDGCNMQVGKSGILNIFTGKPNVGYSYLRQDYLSAPDLNKNSPYLSVCGNFRLETSIDSYGAYAEDPDPFKNEFRNTYRIDTLKIVVPPFFQFNANNPNYVRITRMGTTGQLKYDTSFIQPSVRDSLGFSIIEFSNFNSSEDFTLVQHSFFFDLKPECYVSHYDSIIITKKFKYLRHLENVNLHKDLYSISKLYINTAGVDAGFDQLQKQILKDTIVSWTFKLSTKNNKSTPRRFFTYQNLWMQFENLSGQILIDSLIEYSNSGTRIFHQPRTIGTGKIIYELDTLYDDRRFELFTRFNSCQVDSILVWSGNSCDSYPSEFNALTGKCRDYVNRQTLIYEPEESSIQLDLLAQPIDSVSQPCDSFNYIVQVYNSGLGHSFNNQFYFTAPDGMVLRTAFLEYPKGNFQQLPVPNISVQPGTYFWELSPILFTTGIPGFYKIDENYFKIHFTFDGNCDLEDGQTISFYIISSNVCNQIQRSQIVNSDPFQFSLTNQTQQDLYDIHLSFSADSACGEIFKARGVLYSKNDSTNKLRQKLYFIYAKELSFVPGTFRAIHLVDSNSARFYYLDGFESVEIPLLGPIQKGDSAVFELNLERTCIELCKTTDFRFQLNSEQSIRCSSATGGECYQLLQIQEWKFDKLELSPRIIFKDSELNSSILQGGWEKLDVKYLIENKSPFTGKIDYKINFYYDVNGNGILDSSDTFVLTDQVSGSSIEGFSSSWHNWSYNVPGNYTCRMIAVISPLDNPCLCSSDTLILNTPQIIGENKRIRICYDQNRKIGFDSISGYSYQWLQSDRLDEVNRHEAIYRYPLTLQAGTEINDTVLLNITKSKGCNYQDTVFVEIYRLDAEALQIDSILCNGDQTASIQAKGIGTNKIWNYKWLGRTDTGSTIKNLGPGIYRVIVSDTFGCSAFDSVLISEPPPLNSKLSISSNYNGYSISCNGLKDGMVTVNVQGGTPSYTYNWSKGNGMDSIKGLSAGWIKVQVLDKNLCPTEDSVLLTEPPPLKLKTSSNPSGCDDQSRGWADLTISGGVPGYNFLWNNGEKTERITNLKSGKYLVEVTDSNGCKINGEAFVDQLPDPLISVNLTDTTLEYGNSVRLRAWTNALNPKFLWTPASELSCDSCSSVIVSPTTDQTIRLLVTDENGCTSEVYFNIRVAIIKNVWAPNVFSPNGDQTNDRFTIYGKPTLISIDKLQIFDRWGELIYEENDLPPHNSNYGWDGTFKGQLLNPAVFVYVAHVRFVDGETRLLYGDVTLVR